MAIQLSGNTSMVPAFPGVRASADATVEHYGAEHDMSAGLFVFTDAGGTAGNCEIASSGNVPANISEVAGVTEYLPGKTASGASGEQYADGDQVSVVKNGRIWVQAVEGVTDAIKDGTPCYMSVASGAENSKATEVSTDNLLVGVFRSTLKSNNAALVELRLGV